MISVVAALSVVAAGCGGDDDEGTDGTETSATGGDCEQSIWVLLPDSTTSPRWETDDRRYFGEAFTEAGVDFNIVNAEGSAETQQSQAEQAIADDAAVIILTSNDTGSGATIIDQAKEAGVEVIEYDRFNTGGSGGAAYVSFDNEEVGRTMATALEPEIDAQDVETPAVVMLNGGEEDNNSFQFRAGYAETVEAKVDAGDWTLAADQHVPGWGANGEGQGIMEQILTDANNEINGVFAANDNLAQQAINALRSSGRWPDPRERSGCERGRDAERRPREPDDERLQAVPGRGGSRGRGRARALHGRGLPSRPPTDYQSDLASGGSGASIIGIDTETGEATASADEEGVDSLRRSRAHLGHRRQHRRHRHRGQLPDDRGDLHGRRRTDGLLSGELLISQSTESDADFVEGRRRPEGASSATLSPSETTERGATPLLETKGVSRAFGAVQALYQVDFEVRRGEVMALVGDNGAGKSTLIKGVVGIHPFDEGEVWFEGRDVDIHGPRDAAQLGIEVVYQDLALADNLDVVANMFLGRERVRNLVVLDEPSMERESRAALDSLSVTTLKSVRQRVAGLSGGQRQAVAVAKSVMWDSKLVILDEPTAALGVAQTRQVLDLVRRLAERDLGVVIITHNLHDVFEVADRITVLRLGQRVAMLETSRTTQQDVVHAITAGTLDHVPGMDEAGPLET